MRTTVDEALNLFTLIGGSGSEADHKACAMSLLAWLDECDEWTDNPQCAHPLIADTVISGNDADGTTSEMRAELVRLGVDGVLDTWWVPTEVVMWAMAAEPGETVTAYQRAERMLRRLAAWKQHRQRPNLTRANLAGANLARANLADANLADANLADADLTGAYLARAYLAGAYLTRADLTGANLADAYLTDAYLTGARGTPRSGMPAGWALNDAGLWVKA